MNVGEATRRVMEIVDRNPDPAAQARILSNALEVVTKRQYNAQKKDEAEDLERSGEEFEKWKLREEGEHKL